MQQIYFMKLSLTLQGDAAFLGLMAASAEDLSPLEMLK